ncbi:hypothetical protein ACH5RR_040823 [Cinchona calisaya]|uniref:RNase H type-1 domain-containing protein n=1 Tax=Cinchona calisaya TaxID=153742 RepID=A0ABD2XTT6_9GENT
MGFPTSGSFKQFCIKKGPSSVVKQAVLKGKKLFNSGLTWRVKNGLKARFWLDNWTSLGPIRNLVQGPLNLEEEFILEVRNKSLFDPPKRPFDLVNFCLGVAIEFVFLGPSNKGSPNLVEQLIGWVLPPPPHTTKLNTDGSSMGNPGQAGAVQGAFSGIALEVGFVASLEGLAWALTCWLNHRQLETASKCWLTNSILTFTLGQIAVHNKKINHAQVQLPIPDVDRLGNTCRKKIELSEADLRDCFNAASTKYNKV